MSVPAAAIPTPRQWRARVKRARRAHHNRPLGELLNDLYLLFWVFGVYGGVAVAAVRHHLATFAPPPPVVTDWIVAGALLMAAGGVWRGLRAVGPLLSSPAEQAWGLSSPVDRGAWLRPRLILLVVAAAALFALVGIGVAVFVRRFPVGWTGGAAAMLGAALAGAAVWAQAAGRAPRWWYAAPWVLLFGGGLLLAAMAVGAHATGRTLPLPGSAFPLLAAGVGAALAVAAFVPALRALERVDMVALGAGAQLAAATVTAAVGLDPSLLAGILEARRWRGVGRVRSRPFLPGPYPRAWVLLQAEIRRQLRRPGALGAWALLALGQYAVAVAAPSAAPSARIVLAYFAVNRLTSGLRAVSRSVGLRRALGGGDLELRLVHLVVPAVGAAAWWLATLPAAGAPTGRVDIFLVAGVVAAAMRAATRPPMSYDGTAFETPLGLFPMDLIFQLVRGLDLLGATLILRMLA